MKRVGIVGWRGMVGSVLLERMKQENDFRGLEPVFFSTSQAGSKAPDVGVDAPPVADANDVTALSKLEAIISCQGGDYTTEIFPALRKNGWKGYWIDAASTLRMKDHAVIILDPVNRSVIDAALDRGVKDYVGGNCTVSLMLMVMAGPMRQGMVEWVSSMTYQAASGAGAKNMQELVAQMRAIAAAAGPVLDDPAKNALDLDRNVSATLASPSFPTSQFGAPLAASLIAWIDKAVENGQSREEWKGHVEANKILALSPEVPIDGLCVRVGAMRCHSQGLTIKLRKGVPLDEFEGAVRESNEWAKVVPNTIEDTKKRLSPAAITGSLDVAIGRIHKMRMGPDYVTAFTVGDQLLWGAAEPLRRMLKILRER
jgi:aspartate-semialdehyde dehydrogenase